MAERKLWKFAGRGPIPTPQGWILCYLFKDPDYPNSSWFIEMNQFWGRPIQVYPGHTPITTLLKELVKK